MEGDFDKGYRGRKEVDAVWSLVATEVTVQRKQT